MAVMLATYQYFTTKRSSDNVLNKDELRLQAELSCMKQYHEFASSKNEFITNAGNKAVILNGSGTQIGCAGNETGSNPEIVCNNGAPANYTCTGSTDITVAKYCTNNSGLSFIDCQTACENKGYHCVATTKWKKFSNDDKYLASQILKSNVNIASESDSKYVIKDKITYFATKPTLTKNEKENGVSLKAVGLVSCVEACKISSQKLLEGHTCADGEMIDLSTTGEPICVKLTDAAACTSHEDLKDSKLNNKCTGVGNGKYCCPKEWHNPTEKYCSEHTDATNCCPAQTMYVWGTDVNAGRFYTCQKLSDVCKNQNISMSVVNEKGESLSIGGVANITINDALNSKYSNTKNAFTCNVKQENFINACKALVKNSSEYAYLKTTFAYLNNENNEEALEDLTTTASGSSLVAKNVGKIKIKCHIASKKNSSSVENCTPCQKTVFDQLNNKWTCKNYTSSEVIGNTELINTLSKQNEKGAKACLSTCSTAQIAKLKAGEANGKYWGFRWDEKAKMFSCFNCDPKSNYNYLWHCSGGAPNTTEDIMALTTKHTSKNEKNENVEVSCSRQSDWRTNAVDGKCMPFNCASEYQVQINGTCYTKWCNKNLKGFPKYAEINAPKIRYCPNTAPWMTYNTVQTCVYCIRPPDVKTN